MSYLNSKNLKISRESGMTYVELIVVLSIFSVMATIVMFNYGGFQAKVDIKNLANDIALKAVQAEKESLAGKIPPVTQFNQTSVTWKPSYGIYINKATDNKSFIYFTDINQDGLFVDTTCPGNDECLQKNTITKGNIISYLDVFYSGGTSAALNDLTVSFIRPDATAIIKSSTSFTGAVSYVQITILSPKGLTAAIKIYPSGRIQIN